MMKLWHWSILGVLLFAGSALRASPPESMAALAHDHRLGSAAPFVEPVDQTYLTRFVRRVLTHQVRHGQPYESAYVPPALVDLKCRVSVSLRDGGQLLATADADALPVLQSVRQACTRIVKSLAGRKKLTEQKLLQSQIEIELIGPRQRVGTGEDTPIQLSLSYEPAIHGIAVRVDNKEILVRPSQLISKEVICPKPSGPDHHCDRYEAAIASLREKLGLLAEPPKHDPGQVVFLRFRTMHLFESEPNGQAVHLIAGMRYVHPDEVTPESMRLHTADLARFIRDRQLSEGIFAYEFLPGRDVYWPGDQNWIRQAATTWALAHYARQRGDKASAQAADRAIAAFKKMVRPLEGLKRAAYVATPDNEPALGTTALFCLALIDAPDSDRYMDLRLQLLNGIASLQQDDGSFRTHFPSLAGSGSQDYYPGEALLAVAKHYAQVREAKWRNYCDKSFPFYVNYFRATETPMFVPWQTQAWGQMARTTRLQRYADFVFEMSDAVVATQVSYADPTLSIYRGGFDVHGVGRTGVSTAVYIEGLVEAVRTAEAMGDKKRAERYRKAVQRATRFVIQLRFRPEECYYVRSLYDVVGGVRNAPAGPTLRIDNTQHALSALLGAREVWSGKKGKSP